MKKVKSLLQLEYFRRQKYLREDSEEIALANLKLLMGSSIAALSLLVLFLLLSPFMIKGWEITPQPYRLPSGRHCPLSDLLLPLPEGPRFRKKKRCSLRFI